MSTVRDMIRKKGSEVYSILPSATVYEALVIMAKYNTGAVLVATGNKVDGILSERDCVRRVELEGRSVKNTKVSEIMTTKVIFVEASQPLEECMALMINKNIRHLPVMDEGILIGMISIGDVVKQSLSEKEKVIKDLEDYIWIHMI